jgi:hypothetical protein
VHKFVNSIWHERAPLPVKGWRRVTAAHTVRSLGGRDVVELSVVSSKLSPRNAKAEHGNVPAPTWATRTCGCIQDSIYEGLVFHLHPFDP